MLTTPLASPSKNPAAAPMFIPVKAPAKPVIGVANSIPFQDLRMTNVENRKEGLNEFFME